MVRERVLAALADLEGLAGRRLLVRVGDGAARRVAVMLGLAATYDHCSPETIALPLIPPSWMK